MPRCYVDKQPYDDADIPEFGGAYARRDGTQHLGDVYEVGVAAVLLWRAFQRWPRARLATNAAWARDLDDLALIIPDADPPTPSLILMQLKHKNKPGSRVTKHQLSGKKDFGLQRYLAAFEQLRDDEALWSRPELRGRRAGLVCVLYTNAVVDCPPGDPADPAIVRLLGTGAKGKAHHLLPSAHTYLRGPHLGEFLKRFVLFSEQAPAQDIPSLLSQEMAQVCGLLPCLRDASFALLRDVERYNQSAGDVVYLGRDSPAWRGLAAALAAYTRAPDGVGLLGGAVATAATALRAAFERSAAVAVAVPGSCAQLRSCALAQALKHAQSLAHAQVREYPSRAQNVISVQHERQTKPVHDSVQNKPEDTNSHLLRRKRRRNPARRTPVFWYAQRVLQGQSLQHAFETEYKPDEQHFSSTDNSEEMQLAEKFLQNRESHLEENYSNIPLQTDQGVDCVLQSQYVLFANAACNNETAGVISLWLQSPHAVLVVDVEDCSDTTCHKLLETLNLYSCDSDRKLILTSAYPKKWPASSALVEHITLDLCFCDFNNETQTLIMSTEVSLQGAKPVPLSSVVTSRALQHVDIHSFAKLLTPGPPPIFGRIPHPPPSLYIQRTLQADVEVDPEVLRNRTMQDLFLVSGVRIAELKEVIENTKPVHNCDELSENNLIKDMQIFVSVEEHERDFSALCERRGSRPAHWLRRSADGWRWMASAGDPYNFARYVDAKRRGLVQGLPSAAVDEETVLLGGVRTVALGAEPGMGKTALLRFAVEKARALFPHRWVLLLELQREFGLLRELRGAPAREVAWRLLEAGARVNDGACPALAAAVLRHAVWVSGEAVLLVDAVDEVAPDYEVQVIALLRQLASSPAAFILAATRPVTRSLVEEALGATSLSLAPLSPREQERLLAGAWRQRGASERRLEARSRRLLARLRTVGLLRHNVAVTGAPLIVCLLAEVFERWADDGAQLLVGELSLSDLYSQLVDKKFKVFLETKQNKDLKNIAVLQESEDLKRKFQQDHSMCALKLLLSDSDLEELKIHQLKEKTQEFLKKISNGTEKTGFILSEVAGKAVFIHQTFAEYFVALWLSKNWMERRKKISSLLLCAELASVRELFDYLLAPGAPLHLAVLNGSLVQREDAWLRRQDVGARDAGGRTALHLAAQTGDAGFVNAVLALGADIEALDDLHGLTPLHYAARAGAWDVVRLLVERGARVRSDALACFSMRRLLPRAAVPLFRPCEADWPVLQVHGALTSVLHMAASKCSRAGLRQILSEGANVNTRDEHGATPLHCAAQTGCKITIRLLIEAGAKVNAADANNYTPLHWASHRGHMGALQLLLSSGANVHARGPDHESALHLAAAAGRTATVRRLLATGADPDASGFLRRTPLHAAARTGSAAVVQELLKAGADITARDIGGLTPLVVALANHQHNVVKILVNTCIGDRAQNKVLHKQLQQAYGSTDVSETGHQDLLRDLQRRLFETYKGKGEESLLRAIGFQTYGNQTSNDEEDTLVTIKCQSSEQQEDCSTKTVWYI